MKSVEKMNFLLKVGATCGHACNFGMELRKTS